MSDLLASLVDRALDRAPVLQRRQPALFEPVVEAAFSGRVQVAKTTPLPEEEVLVEREPSPEHSKSYLIADPARFPAPSSPLEETQATQVRPGPTRQRRAPDVNPFREDDRENSRQSEPAARVIDSRANPSAHEEQPSRSLVNRAFAKPEEVKLAPQRFIETIVEKRVEREIISESPADTSAIEKAPGVARQLISLREPSRDHESEPAAPLKTEAKPRIPGKEPTTDKSLRPSKPVPRRDTVPVTRAASRTRSTRAPQPTPPTIHVTIGRVEVRATTQASTRPPAARSAAPRMSLEDYLRSRGEGK